MKISEQWAEQIRKQDSGPLPLTPEGFKRLQDKLARLKRSAPELAAEAARTAAYGDRSDNAEYKQAKGSLRRAQWQILEIEDQLKRAVIIERGANATGTVQLGSTVVLEVKGATGAKADASGAAKVAAKKTFEIVGPFETDPSRGRISHKSPLGAALIGHVKGDVVEIKIKDGVQEYRILEVR